MTAAVWTCSARLGGWRWRGQPVTCWRPVQGLRRCAWRRPGIYLACTFRGPRRARPGRQCPVRLPVGEVQPCRSPDQATVRPPLRRQPHPPAGPGTSPTPAIFRLTIKGPQLRHPRAAAVSDPDPDHAACRPDRDRDRLAAAPEPLCRMLFPDSSLTSTAASSRHGCPGPGTPAVNARATRARSARPATVTLSRTTALATSAPAFPARPAAREITRDRGRAHGDARPARRPGSSRKHAAGAARPWPSVKQPTVRTDRDEARIPSAMRPWTPRHVDPQ
jgi:hypothetical protein